MDPEIAVSRRSSNTRDVSKTSWSNNLSGKYAAIPAEAVATTILIGGTRSPRRLNGTCHRIATTTAKKLNMLATEVDSASDHTPHLRIDIKNTLSTLLMATDSIPTATG